MAQLSVTVTEDEMREVQGLASLRGATVSNYVRELLGFPALLRGRSGRQNDEVTRQASEERRTKGVRATNGDGTPIDLHHNERLDIPFPPPFPDPAKLKMTVPYLNGDTQRQREDEASDEAHELAYEPVED